MCSTHAQTYTNKSQAATVNGIEWEGRDIKKTRISHTVRSPTRKSVKGINKSCFSFLFWWLFFSLPFSGYFFAFSVFSVFFVSRFFSPFLFRDSHCSSMLSCVWRSVTTVRSWTPCECSVVLWWRGVSFSVKLCLVGSTWKLCRSSSARSFRCALGAM